MTRAFTPEPVAPPVLERILGAGARAPTAGNCRGVSLLALTGPAETARHWDVSLPAGERRAAFGHPGLLAAPVLVEVLCDPAVYVARYAEADKARTGLGDGEAAWPVPYWFVDAGMAAMAVLLAAEAEGLGACFFGLFGHERAVLDHLGVAAGVRSAGAIAIGRADPAAERPGRSVARPT